MDVLNVLFNAFSTGRLESSEREIKSNAACGFRPFLAFINIAMLLLNAWAKKYRCYFIAFYFLFVINNFFTFTKTILPLVTNPVF